MIRSMTAYTHYDIQGSWGNASWEIRSVNQRYLEIYIRLPESFRSLESIIREKLRIHLTRGKIECSLHCEINSSIHSSIILNKILAKQLIEAANWIKIQSDEGEINPLEILGWPHVISSKQQDLNFISNDLINALELVINNFIIAREREGSALQLIIEQKLNAISIEIAKIKQLMPEILQWQRERLLGKLKEAQISLENNRLEQEIIFIAQRLDISEELDRLATHIKETYAILQKQEAIGRRLDFMMQEFNRESNTLASKSINADITTSAIEIKVLIEQIREQIQNIE
ncbi:hypothetical protein GII40_00304 [Candidatus Profftia lariciata]|uniref:YicC/YloC family endoribonuclease n=1 Tax=Candidatus Profftia lariciata TaxID=1987921 RepID=UPI001D00532D|nr:YicC/YloC family endoribonuclease [Candidatus Profftia lariciata]UDG81502.1 hypothetical protein GII40_00304 [Candidatus Profftia lariciata]